MNTQERERSGGGKRLFAAPAISVAAHELKSPLALIRQLTLELQQDTQSGNSQLLEQIRLTSEYSLRLTSNLTKAEQLQTTLFVSEPTNPRAVMGDVIRELGPLYRARQRTLNVSEKSLPLVSTNRDLLRRIVANFADNALHYADADGAVELFGSLQRSRGFVRIGVRDFGPRISQSQWRDMQKAHRSQAATRPDSSGLGLVISQQFADSIGASMGAIRHRDGASFYVDVPISRQLSLL